MANSFVGKLHEVRCFLSSRGLIREHVRHGSSIIPAKHLRFGGEEFKDDEFFVTSGRLEAKRLIEKCCVTGGSRVLDVGCGVGRLPIGILSYMDELPEYWGIDVDAASVGWCRRHIERDHPRFHFEHINAGNRRYNPEGGRIDETFRFPFADDFLVEFQRVLVRGGKVFFTAFTEENVPAVMENPPGYRMPWSGALHCVRYEKTFLESMATRLGFEVSHFEYGKETDGQSAIYLSLR